jgi:catechol 2,3-dioxygenase-like lactoylglutathione lyase family enzyme
MKVREILETCLYVDDLGVAETFYRAVLGLEVITHEPGRHVFFRCGGRFLLLFNAEETRKSDEVAPHGATGASHVAFAIAQAELAPWRDRLAAHNVPIELEYDWPQGGYSLYFRDPAGNSLELATPAVWRANEDDVFPGIT